MSMMSSDINSKHSSPSRTYVAFCWKTAKVGTGFEYRGYYLKKFTLPEQPLPEALMSYIGPREIRNDIGFAVWWFLNVLDHFACIEGLITIEDYQDISDAKEFWKEAACTA